MTESFDDVLMTVRKYRLLSDRMCNRLQKAHDHEMEQLHRLRFREGYEAGQRSMDAEHYAVALRLKHLPLDEDSHGNLSQIARAVWHSDFGWTNGACKALRDELVRLLGGVHEPEPTATSGCACDAACDCGCEQPTQVVYDELSSERHKAVCELRNMHLDTGSAVKKLAIALGVKWNSDNAERSVTLLQNRLIYLLGGDTEPNSQKSPNLSNCDTENGGEVTITDELRKFATDPLLGYASQELHVERITAIADCIEEQEHKLKKQRDGFKRGMVAARDLLKKRTEERDDLRKSLQKIAEHAGVKHDLELPVYDDDIVAKATVQLVSMMHKHIKTLEEKLDTIREALDG